MRRRDEKPLYRQTADGTFELLCARHRENCEEVIRLYREGLGSSVIGGRFGRSGPWVLALLNYHQIPIRPQGTRPPEMTAWHSEAVAMFRAGDSATKIGFTFHVSRERVRQVLNDAGIEQTRQHGHRCNDTCRIVLAAQSPLILNPLSRESGASPGALRLSAKWHGIAISNISRSRHVCDFRCEIVLKALKNGQSIRQAGRDSGFSAMKVYVRLKGYHPDWPWPGPKWWLLPGRLPHHRCDDSCRKVGDSISAGSSLAAAARAGGWRVDRMYSEITRRQHPDWKWPAIRTYNA